MVNAGERIELWSEKGTQWGWQLEMVYILIWVVIAWEFILYVFFELYILVQGLYSTLHQYLTIYKYFTLMCIYACNVETAGRKSCFGLDLLLLNGDYREGTAGLCNSRRIMWYQCWCWGDTKLNKSPGVQKHLPFPHYFHTVWPLIVFPLEQRNALQGEWSESSDELWRPLFSECSISEFHSWISEFTPEGPTHLSTG